MILSDNIEEMKIRFCLIVPLLIILSLTSCASNPSVENEKAAGSQGVHKEKKQNPKKLLFEDWKYKGFGHELPVWFEAAYKGDLEEVQKKIADSQNRKIEIITAQGVNSDQAEKSLMNKIFVKAELCEVYESSWVLLSEKEAVEKNDGYPYFAAAVLYINKE